MFLSHILTVVVVTIHINGLLSIRISDPTKQKLAREERLLKKKRY